MLPAKITNIDIGIYTNTVKVCVTNIYTKWSDIQYYPITDQYRVSVLLCEWRCENTAKLQQQKIQCEITLQQDIEYNFSYAKHGHSI